ncbi:Hypp5732 [Branchiostoma lanceolatum]|uniref:Hypp5732 protein n=1 Tax=Branchiostoma lanceolatum TaxID=7740 RepID=A0A8J9VF87_BRALA|nr:Hypp5732 [Branchiostoma lanceolatum]
MSTSLTHPAAGTIEDNADDSDVSDTPVNYTLGRRKRGMLVSSTGYSYTVKPVKQGNGQTTHWRCTKRNGSVDCRAIVTQKGEQYQPELAASLQARAGHHPGLPSQVALLRQDNRARAKMRPEEPKDLEDLMNFQLDEHYLPEDFLRADFPVGVNRRRRRHLLLATQQQLDFLCQ